MPEPFNSIVLTTLFELCQWHAYAKLRLHSETTLAKFEAATTTLGAAMRSFKRNVCDCWVTKELPSETQSRQRRAARLAGPGQQGGAETAAKVSTKQKIFNLHTYKYHRLADYPQAVRDFGSSDNTTTQPVRYALALLIISRYTESM